MTTTNQENVLRQIVSIPLTNVTNYPENVRAALLGADLTTIIEAVVARLVEENYGPLPIHTHECDFCYYPSDDPFGKYWRCPICGCDTVQPIGTGDDNE